MKENARIGLTLRANDQTVVLPLHFHVPGDAVVKDLRLSLNHLLGSIDSLLRSLNLDLSTTVSASSLPCIRHINLSTGLETQGLHLTTTSANQRRQLVLCDRYCGCVRVVLNILQQAEQFITASISAPARSLDDYLVRLLLRTTGVTRL